jgi:hypothetical protein
MSWSILARLNYYRTIPKKSDWLRMLIGQEQNTKKN